MWGAWPIMLVLASGCGRVNFDPRSDAGTTTSADARLADQIADLIVWYPLDDPSFTGRAIEVIRGLDALCTDQLCPVPAAGTIGGAALFDGTPFLRIPHAPVLDTPSGFTIAAWFRPDTFTMFNAVMSRPVGTSDNNTWQLELPGTVMTRFKLADTLTTSTSYVGPATLGTWLHVAGTWNGSTARLYQDGVEVDSGPQPVTVFDESALYIAADENGGTVVGRFVGIIDDVRLYGRALTPAEVMLLATP